MGLDAKTIEFAQAVGVEADALAFLDKSMCHTYKDIALLTTSEKDVKDDIVAPMAVAGVASAKTMIGISRLRSFGSLAGNC